MSSDTLTPETPSRPRRRYSEEFKRAVVEQTLLPGASVAGIALEHGINANQLFKWRRQYPAAQGGSLVADESSPTLLPVTVTDPEPVAEPASVSLVNTAPPSEIAIRLGRTEVVVRGAVDPATLSLVLASLRR